MGEVLRRRSICVCKRVLEVVSVVLDLFFGKGEKRRACSGSARRVRCRGGWEEG